MGCGAIALTPHSGLGEHTRVKRGSVPSDLTPKGLFDFLLQSYEFLSPTEPRDKLLYAVIALVVVVYVFTASLLAFAVFVLLVLAIIWTLGYRETKIIEASIDKTARKFHQLDAQGSKRRSAASRRISGKGALTEVHDDELDEEAVDDHSSLSKELDVRPDAPTVDVGDGNNE